ncbi:uncharacterized protein TRIADDRAFT_60579 [Trichoplax adhaerens]|uniref:G-protein coupled receptors family 1 profile domain-containing protein n=1 Tax=Trichoplax adhaerens TaxID=10228 RepID=B3S8L3_TRIAD|nr:hypothetical protein TRIADDRAFT_60579 [Trichoplax adhaerens]EDV20904.1 hypothetical protein TRIADDRAFT_60579 [Trichoplax adhaerens]|eukprot:XP_002116548.1 hypothetical protein TRIADDRAFT_60579 [Trichoplax adhaerens]
MPDNEQAASNISQPPFNRHQMAAVITAPVLMTNIILILLISTQRKLRTPSNAIVCNSCIACLVLGIIHIVSAAISLNQISQIENIALFCFFNESTELALSGVVTFHITILALERFFSVVYPFKYERLTTNRNIAILLLSLWIIPICVIFIPVTVTSLSIGGNCDEWSEIPSVRVVFLYVLFPLVLFIPSIITLLAYSGIMYKIYIITSQTWSQQTYTNYQRNSSRYQLMVGHRKALFQMLILLTVYSLSYFPFYAFYVIYIESNRQILATAAYVSYLVAIAYLSFHPILIMSFTANLKEEFGKQCHRLLFPCSSHSTKNKIHVSTFMTSTAY